jgi:hypothetical protein
MRIEYPKLTASLNHKKLTTMKTVNELTNSNAVQVLRKDNTTTVVYFVDNIESLNLFEAITQLKQAGAKGSYLIAPKELKTPKFFTMLAGMEYVDRNDIDSKSLCMTISFSL